MQRHDTHLFSDSEEGEGRSDEMHKYSFNNSKNSINNSENNSLYSNHSKKNSPFRLNNLKNINSNNQEGINDNISIISSKQLEDIFYNEKNNSVKNVNKEKNNNKETSKPLKLGRQI